MHHGMIYYNNSIYLFCGFASGRCLNDMHCYSLNGNNSWRQITINGMPQIYQFSWDLYKNRILMFGGKCPHHVTSNTLYSIDIMNQTIEEIKIEFNNIKLPKTYGHSSVIVGDKLFIYGGQGKFNDSHVYYVDFNQKIPSLHYIPTNLPKFELPLSNHLMVFNPHKL